MERIMLSKLNSEIKGLYVGDWVKDHQQIIREKLDKRIEKIEADAIVE